MKKPYLFFFCILLSVYSCTTDMNNVDIDLSEGFEPQVAISSFLNPDSSISISCMSTFAAYSTKPATVVTINRAIVFDITNSTSYNLQQVNRSDKLDLNKIGLYPQKGSIYKFVVEATNPTAYVEIVDTVPLHKAKITDVKVSSIKNTSDFMGTVTFKPIESESTTYYELLIFTQEVIAVSTSDYTVPYWQKTIKTSDHFITQENYYPSLLLLEAENPQSLLFRLKKGTQTQSVNFEYSAGTRYHNSTISSINNNLRVELRVVSYNYFAYKTSLYKQKYAAEGDLLYGMSAPVKVYSNVKGGVGVIGSYCKTDTTVFVEGKTYRY